MRNKLIVPIVALVLVGAAIWVTAPAFASEINSGEPNPLVHRLAQKFGTSDAEVAAVFDELRAEQHAERETRFETHLQQAVDAGKITADQMQLILQKHDEFEQEHEFEMESFKDMSLAERREKMRAHHEEMARWAEENGIDLSLLRPDREERGLRRGWMHAGPALQ